MTRKQIALGMALSAGLLGTPAFQGVATASEPSYPWCIQGSVLRCYFMSREQCEQTVDYHGFCVANPEMGQARRKGDRG